MLKKELAEALGISGAMVSKLAKRGMPTDSLERAQRWRRRHLEPGRVKGQRMGTTAPPEATPRTTTPPAPGSEVTRANHLTEVAAHILDGGGDIAALLPGIRAALRAVPEPLRDEVQLHMGTMAVLIGPDILTEATPTDAPPEPVTDDGWQEMGRFWYAVAAGEVSILPANLEPEPDLTIPDMGELEWPEGWDNLPEP